MPPFHKPDPKHDGLRQETPYIELFHPLAAMLLPCAVTLPLTPQYHLHHGKSNWVTL
jgi:hypothetical protein